MPQPPTLIHGPHGSPHTAQTIRDYLDQRGVDAPQHKLVLLVPNMMTRLGETANPQHQAILAALDAGDPMVVMVPDVFDYGRYGHYIPPLLMALRDCPTLTYTPDTLAACLETLCTEHLPPTPPLPPPPIDDQHRAEYLCERAFDHYVRDDHLAALADYDTAIDLQPDLLIAYAGRSTNHFRNEDYKAAVADADHAIALAPHWALGHNNRAVALTGQKQFAAALESIQQAINLDPDMAVAYNNRGMVYVSMGNFEAARADLEQALRLDPHLVPAYKNRAVVHAMSNHLAEAAADIDRALQRRPYYPPLLADRATMRMLRGDFFAADEDMTRLIESDPQKPDYWIGRADVRHRMGDIDDAVNDVRRALKLEPMNAQGHIVYGRILMTAKNPRKAVEVLSMVVHDPEQRDVVLIERANAYLLLKQFRLALRDLNAAHAEGNNLPILFINRSVALMRLHRFADALLDVEHALALAPQHLDGLKVRGFWWATHSLLGRARADFEAIAALAPDRPEAQRNARVVRQAHRFPLLRLWWEFWPPSRPR